MFVCRACTSVYIAGSHFLVFQKHILSTVILIVSILLNGIQNGMKVSNIAQHHSVELHFVDIEGVTYEVMCLHNSLPY